MIKAMWDASNLAGKVFVFIPAAIGWFVIIAAAGVGLFKLIF